MKYKAQVLKNGLTLATITDLSTNAVTIGAYIRGGFRFDPVNKPGLSHFCEHMIFNAAKNSPRFSGLVNSVERSGGWRSAFTWIEYQEHVTHLPASHFEEGLELTLKTIFEPVIEDNEVRKEKGVIKEEILRNKADPSRAIWDYAWFPLFFQGTNLSRPYSGSVKDIVKIHKQDIETFTNQYFAPQNTVLFVAGDLEESEIKKRVEKFNNYKNLNKSKINKVTIIPQVKKHTLVTSDNSYYQTSLNIGIKTVPISSSNKHIFEIVREMLGGYFGAPLIQRLRDKGGLIYTWEAFQDNLVDTGYLMFNVTVAHENVNFVSSIIVEEFKRLQCGNFKDDEIEMAKSHLIGSILANTETGRDYIRWYGLQQLLTPNKVLSIKEEIDIYKNIKNDQVRQIISAYFKTEDIFISAIGRADEKSLLKLL